MGALPVCFNFYEPEVGIPPKNLLEIIHPDDQWFVEGKDPEAHLRTLRLDRGFYMFNEWWDARQISVSYPITKNSHYFLYGSQELAELLRELHQTMAPHQKLEGAEIVFGHGAMQLLNAVLYAISIYHAVQKNPLHHKTIHLSHLYVTQQLPGYLELKKTIDAYLNMHASWVDCPFSNQVPQDELIEFVTTLGNPDGFVKRPVTKAKYVVHDRVNHMPILMNESLDDFNSDTLENDWISIFSLSKFLGFSGSRLGYAFVRNPDIAHYMKYYMFIDSHGLCIDGEMRGIQALKYLLQQHHLKEYINFCLKNLKDRWLKIKTNLPKDCELLNNQGANAWIRTPGETSESLFSRRYHIHATYGPEYGVGNEFIRLNMLGKQNEFNELIYRLSNPASPDKS